MSKPQRLSFDHATPAWIRGPRLYFITLCAASRGTNQFCHPGIAREIFAAAEFYHTQWRWQAKLILLMPDHLHALLAFPTDESMPRVISSWKHFLAHKSGIVWQRDFFDHRLRGHEGHQAKADYIRMNPVRAGLVKDPGDWPYVWAPER